MPLGQAPFGSRTPPDDSQQGGGGGFRPGRWILWLVLGSAVLMAGFSFFGPKAPRGDLVECLTDAKCASGERCLVKSKGDGFPSVGWCVKECTAGGQCAVPLECQPVSAVEKHVEAAADGIGPLMVCRLPAAP